MIMGDGHAQQQQLLPALANDIGRSGAVAQAVDTATVMAARGIHDRPLPLSTAAHAQAPIQAAATHHPTLPSDRMHAAAAIWAYVRGDQTRPTLAPQKCALLWRISLTVISFFFFFLLVSLCFFRLALICR